MSYHLLPEELFSVTAEKFDLELNNQVILVDFAISIVYFARNKENYFINPQIVSPVNFF